MKKRVLFSLLAIFLAAIWLGGVSLAVDTTVDCDSDSAVTQIWESTCYDTLANAISAASTWDTIKIIKAGTYQLWWVTFDQNVTIQWLWDSTIITPKTPATTLNSMANNSIKFGTLGDEVTVTLSGVKLQLSWNYAWYWFAWNKESSKVVINNSTVAWRLVTFTNMDFNSVDFVKNNVNTYNIDVHEWRNVNFTNCTFEQNDRNVNVYDWNNDNEDRHDVTFTNCSFKSSTANKWAVNIHESHENQDHVVRYNVTITNAEIEWSYPEDIEVIWQENWYFSKIVAESGLVSIDDIRRVIATEWWEITVKLGTKTIYSTPVTTNAWVTPNTAEELNAIKAWYTNNGYCVPTGLWVVTEWSAKILNQKYCTVTEAINEATQWQIVEILKAWEYTLPATISNNITIKWNVEWVKFSSVVDSAGKIISTLTNWASFDNVTFVLTWVAWKDYKHYFATNDNKEINFENCTIDWTLYVDWNQTANFSNFKFVKNEVNTSSNEYNLHVYWNATFNSGTFENNQSRNVNLWHRMNTTAAENEQYIVTFTKTTFNNTASDTKKAAVMIHEARENFATPWKVIFTDSEVLDESKYNKEFVWWSALYWIDDILTSDWHKEDPKEGTDVSYGTEKWWEVKVTVDWTIVYSTPKKNTTHKVTFDWTWELEVADGSKVSKPATDPTKSCYTFSGWYNWNTEYDFNWVVTSDLALTAKWKNYSCGGGGSSSSSSSSSNKTWDNNTWATAESGTTADTWANTPTVDPQWVATNGYTNEMNEAYEFAYANGITTMKSIDEAEMLDGLTRIAMAKMLSQYAINVLGKSPADVEVPNFTDVSADLDAEYANGVSLAYKLWIMWINMPDNKFLPYETVTRAQFGTALSRLLFGIEDGEDAYYTTHLKKLKEAWIITNDDPTLEELRGYVMLMLMRSSKGGNTVNTSTESAVSNENTNTSAHEVANEPKEGQEVEAYFTEAYRKWQIYGRIWDLQRLLKSLWYYNGDINNTFDNNTIDAVFDFQIAMWILPADDTSSARWNVWPKTRDVLNQKWAEYNK